MNLPNTNVKSEAQNDIEDVLRPFLAPKSVPVSVITPMPKMRKAVTVSLHSMTSPTIATPLTSQKTTPTLTTTMSTYGITQFNQQKTQLQNLVDKMENFVSSITSLVRDLDRNKTNASESKEDSTGIRESVYKKLNSWDINATASAIQQQAEKLHLQSIATTTASTDDNNDQRDDVMFKMVEKMRELKENITNLKFKEANNFSERNATKKIIDPYSDIGGTPVVKKNEINGKATLSTTSTDPLALQILNKLQKLESQFTAMNQSITQFDNTAPNQLFVSTTPIRLSPMATVYTTMATRAIETTPTRKDNFIQSQQTPNTVDSAKINQSSDNETIITFLQEIQPTSTPTTTEMTSTIEFEEAATTTTTTITTAVKSSGNVANTTTSPTNITNPESNTLSTKAEGNTLNVSSSEGDSSLSLITDITPPNLCAHGQIIKGYTLNAGLQAGNFTDKGDLGSFTKCLEACCEHMGCHAAFMIGKNCYLVNCWSLDKCKIRKAKSSKTIQTVLTFMDDYIKDQSLILKHSGKMSVYPTKNNPIKNGGSDSESMYYPWSPLPKNQQLFLKEMSDLSKIANKRSRPSPTPPKGEMTIDIVSEDEHGVTNHVIQNQPMVDAVPTKQPIIIGALMANSKKNFVRGQHGIPDVSKKHLVSSADNLTVCQFSPVSYNVSLRRGRDSGYFTDHGAVLNAARCSEICCDLPHCDVAFMLDKNCFTIKCRSALDCMPVKKPLPFSTVVVYTLYRRKLPATTVEVDQNNTIKSGGGLDEKTSKQLGDMFTNLKKTSSTLKTLMKKDSQVKFKSKPLLEYAPHSSRISNKNDTSNSVDGGEMVIDVVKDDKTPRSPPIDGVGEDNKYNKNSIPEDKLFDGEYNDKNVRKSLTTPRTTTPPPPDQLDGADFPQALNDDSPTTTSISNSSSKPQKDNIKKKLNSSKSAVYQEQDQDQRHTDESEYHNQNHGDSTKNHRDLLSGVNKPMRIKSELGNIYNNNAEKMSSDNDNSRKPIDDIITFKDEDNDGDDDFVSPERDINTSQEFDGLKKRLDAIEHDKENEKRMNFYEDGDENDNRMMMADDWNDWNDNIPDQGFGNNDIPAPMFADREFPTPSDHKKDEQQIMQTEKLTDEIRRLKDKERATKFREMLNDLKNKLIDQKSDSKVAAMMQEMKLKMTDQVMQNQLKDLSREIHRIKSRKGGNGDSSSALVDIVDELKRRIDQKDDHEGELTLALENINHKLSGSSLIGQKSEQQHRDGELTRVLEDVKDELRSPLIGGNSKTTHREEELANGMEELRNDLNNLKIKMEMNALNPIKTKNNNENQFKEEIFAKLNDLNSNLQHEINDVRTNMADKATVELASIEANANKNNIIGDGCKITNIESDAILKNGLNAGIYTEIGKTSMQECAAECCHDKKCSLAFMTGEKCFKLACYSTTSCETEKADGANKYKIRIISLHKEEPPTTTITKSDDTQLLKDILKPPVNDVEQVGESMCFDTTFIEDTTLSGGLMVGKYKRHGEVDTDDQCIDICCHEHNCDLAFMLQSFCYTVNCKSGSCDTEEYVDSVYRPRVAFIRRKERKFEIGLSTRRSKIPQSSSGEDSLTQLKDFLRKKTKTLDSKSNKDTNKDAESMKSMVKDEIEKGLLSTVEAGRKKEELEMKSLKEQIKMLTDNIKTDKTRQHDVDIKKSQQIGDIGEIQHKRRRNGINGDLGAKQQQQHSKLNHGELSATINTKGNQRSKIEDGGVYTASTKGFGDISATQKSTISKNHDADDNTSNSNNTKGDFNDISASHIASPTVSASDHMYGDDNNNNNLESGLNNRRHNVMVLKSEFGNLGDAQQTTGKKYIYIFLFKYFK